MHSRASLLLAALVFFSPSDAGAGYPQPVGQPGAWTLVFSDEFDEPALDTAIWTPGWFGTGITGPVNAKEKTCYSSRLAKLPGDGRLHLHFVARAHVCQGKTRPYTGALVSTNPYDGIAGHAGFQYAYGYLEVRAYVPAAPNGAIANWPAIWSTGQNWPHDGENDTMEGLSGHACFHFHSDAGGPGACAKGKYAGWHTFASDWEPGIVTYYYDGVAVGQIADGVTGAPQFLILNNTQGKWGGRTVAPADLRIAYVRVWRQSGRVR